MKKTIINLLFAGLFLSGLILTSCSKSEAIDSLNNSARQDPTDDQPSILNRDFRITYASDGGTNITAQFNGLTFNFTGSGSSGPAHVWNDLLAQTGSWGTDENGEVTTLALMYPTDIFTQLAFLNRQWMIGENNSGGPRLISGDGDEVQLSTK